MPRHQRLLTAKSALITVVCSGLVFLAGCSSAGGSEAAPSPTPSATHFFESEAAAIEAMKVLISRLDDAETLAVNTGDFSAVDAIYITEEHASVHEGLQFYIDNGVRLVGTYADRNHQLVSLADNGDTAEVSVAFCRNVAGARLALVEGPDVTPPDRPIEQSLKITGYFSRSTEQLTLFDSWDSDDRCADQ